MNCVKRWGATIFLVLSVLAACPAYAQSVNDILQDHDPQTDNRTTTPAGSNIQMLPQALSADKSLEEYFLDRMTSILENLVKILRDLFGIISGKTAKADQGPGSLGSKPAKPNPKPAPATKPKDSPKPGGASGGTPGGAKDEGKLASWKGGYLPPEKFAATLGPTAQEINRRTGIPASVILAQAALETGWGRSSIGNAKNLFGIKGTGPAGSIKVPTKEFVNGRYITIQANFRKYHSWAESMEDHAKLISQSPRYKNCMKNKDNPDQFARELQKAGYATSPTYASSLIGIMKSNNLYKFNL